MEWYIFYDPQSTWGEFFVKADFHVLRDKKGACWRKHTLDFTTIDASPSTVASFHMRNGRLTILHKFISDDPITYVKNFQSSHPELFI